MKQRKKKYKNKKNKKQELSIKKNSVIQKKTHISFKYGIGHVLFFQKRSNVFLVLKTEKKNMLLH